MHLFFEPIVLAEIGVAIDHGLQLANLVISIL